MRTFHYLTNTWLLAMALLPFGFLFIWPWIYSGAGAGMAVIVLLTGFVFSILPLMISGFLLARILSMEWPSVVRFLTWLLVVCASILFSSWFIFGLIGFTEGYFFASVALPAIAASAVSVVLRYGQFRHLCQNPGGLTDLKMEVNS